MVALNWIYANAIIAAALAAAMQRAWRISGPEIP
jgi:hypothetical protein